METKRLVEKDPPLKKDDLIVITGACGFIGGNFALYFTKKGFTRNLGSSELVSVNELLSKVEKIAGVKMKRHYDLTAPRGVAGRNSDSPFIKKMLKWEPGTPLDKGLAVTCKWIKEQYHKRKQSKRVGIG